MQPDGPAEQDETDVEPPELDEITRRAEEERDGKIQAVQESDTDPDEGAVPRGRAPQGRGRAMKVGSFEKERDLVDGAGICSPGRWPPWDRPQFPQQRAAAIRGAIAEAVERLGQNGGLNASQLFDELASGKIVGDPFPPEITDSLVDFMYRISDDDGGGGARPRPGDRPQPVRVRLLQAILRLPGDPDPAVISDYATGVRLGVGVKMPRAPAVFARKRRWKYAEQEYADRRDINDIEATWRDNYKSVQLHVDEVEAQWEDLVKRHLAFKLTPQEAEGRFPRLQVVSMGAVEKAVEPPKKPTVRLVMDGSNGVQVNKRIKPRGQDRSPTAADIKRQQREMGLTRPGCGLVADVREAHKLPRIHPDDWQYQCTRARQGGDVYVHTVGIFGVTSIAYWWARLGGAALRCTI